MNRTPVGAQDGKRRRQISGNAAQRLPGKTKALAQLRGAIGAVQNEHRFAVCSDHVDVCGPVIVGEPLNNPE